MNYFAHGRHLLDAPYLLAGVAAPDWLRVIDRKARVRARSALLWLDDDDPCRAAVARGIVRHHADDRWFHQTRAFAELSLEFTAGARRFLPQDDGFRPSFLGHILVEILLDAELISEAPGRLDQYYRSLGEVDPARVRDAVSLMCSRPVDLLEELIPRFIATRFLYDYASDDKLLMRLNQVMRRVGLPALPQRLQWMLPEARRGVRGRVTELLCEEKSA